MSVLLGLGSNLGDRETNLRRALEMLADDPAVDVLRVSKLAPTEPVGGPPQGPYLNGAAVIRTSLEPHPLLALLKRVETALGRTPGGPRWGPREVDLDILLYGDRTLAEPDLEIPHPRLAQRRFVLGPAASVAGDFVHPTLGRTVAELLEALP